MVNNNLFDEQVGLLRSGTIVDYDSAKGIIRVRLNNASSIKGKNQPVNVPLPHSMFYNNGLFIGTLPAINTPVVIAQGSGGQYYFVSFLSENLSLIPTLNLGELLIRSTDNSKITLDNKNDINIGSANNKLHLNAVSNISTSNFYNSNNFTQASRQVNGLVKRDLKPNSNFDQNTKLENDAYDPFYFTIGLDPTVSPNPIIAGSNKNPPFVEQREIVYEFQALSEVEDELTESALYGNNKPAIQTFTFPNRRKSRADTLSLALTSPNYLMETIKGTVVDIFGNILDINRVPLPIGQDQNTLRADQSTDKVQSYLNIKELQRKSLAFHFEINARKDLTAQNGQLVLPDINSNADYARNRSRFSFDIDKEGQFKLNVPASSEKGNIALLVRNENYSTVGPEDNNNPNKLIFRNDNLDILQDSFAAPKFDINTGTFAADRGSIQLKNGDADGAPQDRITGSHIKHGMPFHDVLATCYSHQISDFINYQATTFIDVASIPLLQNVASDTIQLSGPGANAGGRSGSLHFDGSIDFSVGANTVDRQSLILDTAGGNIISMGRDLQNRSLMMGMDGSCFVQIGGMGVSTDSRFVKQINGQIGAVLDIRVFNSGLRVTMIRIDDNGVSILSPGNIQIHSGQGMSLTSDGNINIEAENVSIQGRGVKKVFGGSI